MVARSESMFGCYDSYSYRLWSLANVWNTCQLPPINNSVLKESDELNTTSDYFIKCPQCQKGCQTFQSLKEHMETNHQDLTVSENGSLSVPSAISPTPASVGPFGCTQCTTSFSSKDQLEKHELLHSPNAQVSCKICNKTFANVYRLQRHMISHDESAVLRKFKCTECDKAFKFKHHLKEHIRIHSGEKPFECGNCGKRFSHSGSYSSHMTSKKCLVMNLKLGRTRTPNNSILDKQSQQQPLHNRSNIKQRANISPINNNLPTSPNHNSYLPILPKYSEAAAAALLQPFYLAPPSLLNVHPYSLSHLLDQLQQNTGPIRPIMEIKEEPITKSTSSSCDNLVMDEHEEKEIKTEPQATNNGDLEAVKRILETVNATVTKELLQANVQKLSETSSDSHSVASIKEEYVPSTHYDEEEEKSEGLAAKLEDAFPKVDDDQRNNDDEIDCESDTTTDHISEDGRKVRVRSLISDEQLKILKDNYKLNPRPKREDLEKIASMIGFSVRVVQVWFQNTRARDRREGRLIQVPFNPPNPTYTSNSFNKLPNFQDEQPLDLSTKKVSNSNESSPSTTPNIDISAVSEPSEVVNLSHKSSRSPTPAFHPYQNLYQNSNSSDALLRQSPAPLELNSSRLAQILAQPAHKLSLPGMGLVPMQFGAPELSFSQLITNLSPNSAKRAWNDASRDGSSESSALEENKRKVSQYVLKQLNSPVMCVQEQEAEGQFCCDQCDKAFSKQSSLARHKYEHSGQRPHKCDECPKAFKHKHHLTEHKRLHSGEKPFQCSKCLKRFSHSGSYSQHMNHRYSYCKPYRE